MVNPQFVFAVKPSFLTMLLNSMQDIFAGLILLILVLVLLGIAYQALGTARDLDRYPPSGKLVDVGGYQLHINCLGQGSPTVVMDYGLGGLSPIWSLVQPEIAKFTRVCTYDRPGYGWSDLSPKPRTSQEMVRELHTLLNKAGIEPPYVLVGHSLGGLNVRLFASQYPEEVVGMVLIDAVPPEVYERLSPEFADSMKATGRMFRFLSLISRIGLLRLGIQILGNSIAPDFVRKLPSEVQPIILAKFLPETFATAVAENLLMAKSAEQVKQTKLDKELPLIILSHGINMFSSLLPKRAERAGQIWQKLQAEMANLSSQGELIIANKSGHDIHIDQPQLAIDAIRQIIEKSKSYHLKE